MKAAEKVSRYVSCKSFCQSLKSEFVVSDDSASPLMSYKLI